MWGTAPLLIAVMPNRVRKVRPAVDVMLTDISGDNSEDELVEVL